MKQPIWPPSTLLWFVEFPFQFVWFGFRVSFKTNRNHSPGGVAEETHSELLQTRVNSRAAELSQ